MSWLKGKEPMSNTVFKPGEVICFHGSFRFVDHIDACQLAHDFGCEISQNLTKRVTKVVIGRSPTERILNRAIEEGITLITEKQFCEFFDVEMDLTKVQPNRMRSQKQEIRDDLTGLAYCVVLDTETTGLSPQSDYIISVAALKVNLNVRSGKKQRVQTLQTLLKPPIEIPREATRVNGITNKKVRRAPRFGEEAQEIRDFIGALPIVGHNIAFDLNFLNEEFNRVNVYPLYENEAYCTMMAYRQHFSGRSSLDAVVDHLLGKRRKGKYHDAMEDVMLTAEIASELSSIDEQVHLDSDHQQVARSKVSTVVKYIFGLLFVIVIAILFFG